jgi:hypothetical protein
LDYRKKHTTGPMCGRSIKGTPLMLCTIAVILLVLWALGLVTSVTAGGCIHALLVFAVIIVVYQIITGRKVV